jgi:hypothetical protein
MLGPPAATTNVDHASSVLTTTILAGAALVILGSTCVDIYRQLRWYEYPQSPPAILFAFWLLALRGAVLSERALLQPSRS